MNRAQYIAIGVTCLVLPPLIWLARKPPPPPAMGSVPTWQLTDQDNKPFGTEQLAGRAYVTSFFFTSCPSICPKIMGAMAKVQARTDADLKLISITVDPQTDTPAQLKSSEAKYGVDPARWRLLTGTDAAIREVVVGGFKTFVGDRKQLSDDVFDIAHGARLVLVDGDGGVRGHFATDAAGLDALVRAYEAL